MIPLWFRVSVSVLAIAFVGLTTRSLKTTISTAVLVGVALVSSL